MSGAAGIEVVTFGCRLNIVESEAMRREAVAAGHRDLTIVNSCAVTNEAARQGRQAIRRARRDRPEARIVVTGCASETEVGFRAMPEVDVVLPNAGKTTPATWRMLAGARPGQVSPDGPDTPSPTHTRGFVEIQNGCDHRCTFCIIPFGRGASRSRPLPEVLRRIAALVEAGTREIVLTGVDITAYGLDVDGRPGLGRLVRSILADVPELPRLRLSSLDCVEIDPILMACLGEPRLMPHLHVSVQAGSDLVLKRMKRRHGRADVIAFWKAARALRPDIVLGADFIAGFPTETEAMFAETLELIEACELTYVHAFPFSARPGTPAARMPAVAGDVMRARAARLREAGDRRLRHHLDRQIGRRLTVLAERQGFGHAEDFTKVRLPPGVPAGAILSLAAVAHDGATIQGAASPDAQSQRFGNHRAE